MTTQFFTDAHGPGTLPEPRGVFFSPVEIVFLFDKDVFSSLS
jgi:hypothetical protein